MRRLFVLLSATVLFAGLSVMPAGADIDSNPNSTPFGPATCEDGQSFDLIYSPTDPSPVGQVAGSNAMGVAKEIWLSNEFGDKLALLTNPMGRGVARHTVFCWWEAPTPTGWVGGEILFGGHGQP